MTQNATTSARTRHINIRAHYIRELVEDGTIKIVFVKSGDNMSDPFTKNVNGELYDKHSRNYIMDKRETKKRKS